MFIHYAVGPNDGLGGQSKAVQSSDFYVAAGHLNNNVGTPRQQAIYFMHELGHNLGLDHGGNDDINRKPNYLSIMNYSFLEGLLLDNEFKDKNGIDYSRFENPVSINGNSFVIDERVLSEFNGLGGSSIPNRYGSVYYCNGNIQYILNVNSSINWNCMNPTINSNVFGDTNSHEQGTINNDINNDNIEGPLPTQVDWNNLVYNGGSIGGNIIIPANSPTDTKEKWPTNEETRAKLDFTETPYAYVGVLNGLFLLPGEQGEFKFKIENLGVNKDTYTIAITSPKGWIDTNSVQKKITIDAKSHKIISVPVNIPTTAKVGESEKSYLTIEGETGALGASYAHAFAVSTEDGDGDGILDEADNCPYEPNSNQKDQDNDGIGGFCDNCFDVFNPDQADTYGSGDGDACEVLSDDDIISDIITTYTDTTGNGTATASIDNQGGNNCGFDLANTGFVPTSSVASTAPTNNIFVDGLFNFKLTQCLPNSTVEITLTWSGVGSFPTGAEFWKFGPKTSGAGNTWYQPAATIDSSNRTITFSVVNNGVGDSDNDVNSIVDPVAIATPAGVVPPLTPTNVESIPTLSEWARIILISIFSLLILTAGVLRKRSN
jgi:hypothetical protein